MSLLLLMEEESLPTYRIMDQQQPLSYSLSASASSPPSSENESNPSDAVIFFGLSLALGIACRHLLRGTRVPYTVALLILGIALGSLEYGTHHRLGKIGDGIRLWSEIDPELLLAVFLPALLFESSFSMEVHQIKVSILVIKRWCRIVVLVLVSHVCMYWHTLIGLCTNSFSFLCILYEHLSTYKKFLYAVGRFLL